MPEKPNKSFSKDNAPLTPRDAIRHKGLNYTQADKIGWELENSQWRRIYSLGITREEFVSDMDRGIFRLDTVDEYLEKRATGWVPEQGGNEGPEQAVEAVNMAARQFTLDTTRLKNETVTGVFGGPITNSADKDVLQQVEEETNVDETLNILSDEVERARRQAAAELVVQNAAALFQELKPFFDKRAQLERNRDTQQDIADDSSKSENERKAARNEVGLLNGDLAQLSGEYHDQYQAYKDLIAQKNFRDSVAVLKENNEYISAQIESELKKLEEAEIAELKGKDEDAQKWVQEQYAAIRDEKLAKQKELDREVGVYGDILSYSYEKNSGTLEEDTEIENETADLKALRMEMKAARDALAKYKKKVDILDVIAYAGPSSNEELHQLSKRHKDAINAYARAKYTKEEEGVWLAGMIVVDDDASGSIVNESSSPKMKILLEELQKSYPGVSGMKFKNEDAVLASLSNDDERAKYLELRKKISNQWKLEGLRSLAKEERSAFEKEREYWSDVQKSTARKVAEEILGFVGKQKGWKKVATHAGIAAVSATLALTIGKATLGGWVVAFTGAKIGSWVGRGAGSGAGYVAGVGARASAKKLEADFNDDSKNAEELSAADLYNTHSLAQERKAGAEKVQLIFKIAGAITGGLVGGFGGKYYGDKFGVTNTVDATIDEGVKQVKSWFSWLRDSNSDNVPPVINRGVIGPAGPQGVSGDLVGPTGPTGATGTQEVAAGNTGPAGPDAAPGTTGSSGVESAKGVTGAAGTTGQTGSLDAAVQEGGATTHVGGSPANSPIVSNEVAFGARGAIGGFDKLHESLIDQYGPDPLKWPSTLSPDERTILEATSNGKVSVGHELAQKYGMYDPNAVDGKESAVVMKPDRLGFDADGKLVFHSTEGDQVLTSGGDPNIKMFDYDEVARGSGTAASNLDGATPAGTPDTIVGGNLESNYDAAAHSGQPYVQARTLDQLSGDDLIGRRTDLGLDPKNPEWPVAERIAGNSGHFAFHHADVQFERTMDGGMRVQIETTGTPPPANVDEYLGPGWQEHFKKWWGPADTKRIDAVQTYFDQIKMRQNIAANFTGNDEITQLQRGAILQDAQGTLGYLRRMFARTLDQDKLLAGAITKIK